MQMLTHAPSQLADRLIQDAMKRTPGADYVATARLLLAAQRQMNAVDEATIANLDDHIRRLRQSQEKIQKSLSFFQGRETRRVGPSE